MLGVISQAILRADAFQWYKSALVRPPGVKDHLVNRDCFSGEAAERRGDIRGNLR